MFARTRRLTLRPGWIEDAAELTQAVAHESVAMKLAQLPWPYGVADAREYLSLVPGRGEAWCVILAHEGGERPRLIGGIGIHTGKGDAEIGYWLTPDAWGFGYATEAGHAMLGIARYALGHRRLAAYPHVDNPASARVLRKLGFVVTGRIEQRLSRARGHNVPSASYTLVCGDEDADPARMAA